MEWLDEKYKDIPIIGGWIKIIDSEIKNILNAVIILFCTRIVILPSLDSNSKSLDQLVKTKGNISVVINNISDVITLNHWDIINRKAEPARTEGARWSSVIKKAWQIEGFQDSYTRILTPGWVKCRASVRNNILFPLLRR